MTAEEKTELTTALEHSYRPGDMLTISHCLYRIASVDSGTTMTVRPFRWWERLYYFLRYYLNRLWRRLTNDR